MGLGGCCGFVALGLFLFSAASPFGVFQSAISNRDIKKDSELVAAVPQISRFLDGVKVNQGKENHFPIAAMIENHTEARPQSGLAKAQLVFEAPVEGGITRFLAVFTDYSRVEKMGPVRSARPYYLDWAMEFDPLYLHVGGSEDALDKLKQIGIRDLDQYFEYQYYWRSPSRAAPHNVYTSGELLGRALRDKDLEGKTGNFTPWKFADAGMDGGVETSSVKISFSSPEYEVNWKYDAAKKSYARFYGTVLHTDEDGTAIEAKNIALLYTPILIIDEVGRRSVETLGTGRAVIFQNGKAFEGTWEKLNRKSRLRFFVNEKEVEFVPGATWVEVVSKTFDIAW
ncbi:MAG: hypothetical protein G01um101418_216 [Parcubacteria group bacterium Gr01-1014_18]|nr:MAG: hypothetical protein Greene041636_184 [Parcubacteria group bacterium Greene0416_36]TSC81376.1 MAG: hypothetical protein G01um101418_216 [Parcubacteria group bacterium Gr01-1014_18]TSC99438.1 MAG: hypothetical protein Greene101420_105 [Parcubacteria group bacterium Greene1014_20]TSD07643.1 MAG: hypothetical protein Greene07142_100 [Parcubacteria group bacterium Greene0714_2]